MLGSESSKFLPPFNKNQHISSSLAPFKSSLNKNPSYFSLVRSPDVIQEKKKLKEENWKLKQVLHSLNEEILKLKQKNSQKVEPKVPEGGQFLNQSRYIDVLQDSLRALRNDLAKKKQENVELRKKLHNRDLPEGPKVKSSRGSFHSNDSGQVQDKEAQEKVINELSRTVNYLKSELKILQEEKNLVESAALKHQEQYEELKLLFDKRNELEIVRVDDVGVKVENIVLNIPRRMSSSVSLMVETDKVLKRENLKNEKANVDRFFRNFFSELDAANIELEQIIRYIQKSQKNMGIELFVEVLNYYRIRVNPIEIGESLNYLSDGSNLEKQEFISLLEKYQNEFDSSKSSDISSGSDIPSIPKITISKHIESGVSTIFDNISLQIREIGLDKHSIIKSCQDHLPQNVNFSGLLNFLMDHAYFIQDPSDKTFVTVNFMEGFELKSKNEIIQKCVEGFFKYPDEFETNYEITKDILGRISDKKQEVLTKCKEIDSLQLGTLSWEVLFEILNDKKLVNSGEIMDFKYHCFFLGKNLKKIPYKELFEDESVEVPKIKAFVRLKSNQKD